MKDIEEYQNGFLYNFLIRFLEGIEKSLILQHISTPRIIFGTNHSHLRASSKYFERDGGTRLRAG